MATINQCQGCRYYLIQKDRLCGLSAEDPVYDETSCSMYRGLVDMSESEEELGGRLEVSQEHEVIRPESDGNDEAATAPKKITGWLFFLLWIYIGLGGVSSLFLSISTFDSSLYFPFEDHYIVAEIFGYIVATLGLLYMPFLSAYTLYSFYKFNPNAVALAKLYVIVAFAATIFGLIGGEGQPTDFIRLVVSVVWFVFLHVSEQVNRLFPRAERKIYKLDWWLIASIILFYAYYILIGMVSVMFDLKMTI